METLFPLWEKQVPLFKNLINQSFGRLIAVCPIRNRSKDNHLIWLCRCSCGNLVEIVSNSLLKGNTKSCGCLHRENSKKRMAEFSFKHGDAKTGAPARIYRIWMNMKTRCLKPNKPSYKYYGGKGIIVCAKWLNNYQHFKDWALASGYTDNLTIDRINHNGNYEPSNCQWITRVENAKKASIERRGKRK